MSQGLQPRPLGQAGRVQIVLASLISCVTWGKSLISLSLSCNGTIC